MAIEKINSLYTKHEAIIKKCGRSSATLLKLFSYLKENPIINIAKTATVLGLSFNAVSIAVNRLCDMSILTKSSGNLRNRTFSYEAYLEILRDGT